MLPPETVKGDDQDFITDLNTPLLYRKELKLVMSLPLSYNNKGN
jgi:hypothetical protein